MREIANNQGQRALGLCLERESRSPSRRLRSWLVSGDVFFIVAFEKECENSYRPFFYSAHGQTQLKQELDANIAALFTPAEANQSIQCRFPARSKWLIGQLNIASISSCIA